jgi:hypothetical protein
MLLMEQPSSQGPAKISGLAPWLVCHQLTIEARQSLRLAVGWGTATEGELEPDIDRIAELRNLTVLRDSVLLVSVRAAIASYHPN